MVISVLIVKGGIETESIILFGLLGIAKKLIESVYLALMIEDKVLDIAVPVKLVII